MTPKHGCSFRSRPDVVGQQSNTPMNKTMKTMMELLISLQRFDAHLQTVCRRQQLSPREEQAARWHLHLVREIIPTAVLVHYDQMETTADLRESPELFAMAVLLATYGSLSSRQRKKFLNHFATEPHAQSPSNGHANNRPSRVEKRLVKATRRQVTARN